tara:strand:- start:5183 stop:5686 length:504 start_codon:yes stop_codon:yes gene_type:complete
MSILDKQQKLDLQSMIKANETEDVTEQIRKNKQSNLIRTDIKQLLFLKQKYTRLAKSNPNEFDKICVNQCQFLFNNYTDIFNKIKTDTLNLTIMDKFLNILKKIEDCELDQHEGSYLVGQHLKELYIDSAMRNQEKMEATERKKKVQKKPTLPEKNISYKDFKKMQN